MKSNFRRRTQKRRNKANRKSSKITGGDFFEEEKNKQRNMQTDDIPYYFIYDLLPKHIRHWKTTSNKRDLNSWYENFETVSVNKYVINPGNVNGINFASSESGVDDNKDDMVKKYICLSLKDLNDEQKGFISALLKWVSNERTNPEYPVTTVEINRNRSAVGNLKRWIGVKGQKLINYKIERRHSVGLFESITFNEGTGKLIFELSNDTAELLKIHEELLTITHSDITITAFLVYIQDINVYANIQIPQTNNPLPTPSTQPITAPVSTPSAPSIAAPVYGRLNLVGGRLIMNQKRNKTNRPNRKRNKRISSRIIKYIGNI